LSSPNPVRPAPKVRLALHGASLPGTELPDDVASAKAAGFDAIELWWPKVVAHLGADGTLAGIRDELGELQVAMLNVLMPIEARRADQQASLLKQCEQMAAFATAVGCRSIQAVALDDFATADWAGQRAQLLEALTAITERAWAHGVRIALEPVSFSPLSDLEQALDLIDAIGFDRVGLVLDTWHLWTADVGADSLAGMDPELVDSVQVSDATPRSGTAWSDADRAVLPGDGLIPLADYVVAITRAGYRGTWSSEALGMDAAQWPPQELAVQLRERLAQILAEAGVTPPIREEAGVAPQIGADVSL
jgi:sugar phosphate isomerase/epimerase